VVGYLVLTASRLWMVREFGLVLGAAVMLSYLAARLVLWLRPPGTSTVAGAPDGKSSLTAVSVEVNA
jgi:hypothetical protein